MATFELGDVVKVPFPYKDRPVRERRPALIVGILGPLRSQGLLWVLMITSASHRRWDGDVEVADLAMAGLPAPSVVRTAKIATIEAHDALALGRLSASDHQQVTKHLEKILNQEP